MMTNTSNFSHIASVLWSVADLLRGDFKQSQYGRIILPFTLLRRLECVLEENKHIVLQKYEEIKNLPYEAQDKLLTYEAKHNFYNTSKIDLNKLGETDIARNLDHYIQSFSPNVREIFEQFDMFNVIDKLGESDLLYQVIKRFAVEDLHPDIVDNYTMGLVFEELIRKFAESSNETAGEHFTPRDIIELTTSLVFSDDNDALTKDGVVRTIYDPTAGTGGFLSAGMEYGHELNANADFAVFGQELNPESYAICKGDMLIKGQKIDNIKLGNTLSNDQLSDMRFDYMLSNPPFGVDWKKIQKTIVEEHKDKGFAGRFGAGLPRVSDGSLLFLLHLISKMRPLSKDGTQGGSRIGIILNGSPLFTGGAGSGESEIRRYILEHDFLEAIIALPTDMFYNTGISTYVWILSNKKPADRKGKVQLINAANEPDKKNPDKNQGMIFYQAMRKSLGSKRKELTSDGIDRIVKTYGDFIDNEYSKIFEYQSFGYRRITIDRPLKLKISPKDADKLVALQQDNAWKKIEVKTQTTILQALSGLTQEHYLSKKQFEKELNAALSLLDCKLKTTEAKLILKYLGQQDETAEICKSKGKAEANSDLRDYENVPLDQDIYEYFDREVKPHVPDAWIDEGKCDAIDGKVGIVGYEISFNRYFYIFEPPRALQDIDAELDQLSAEIMKLLQEVHS